MVQEMIKYDIETYGYVTLNTINAQKVLIEKINKEKEKYEN